MDAKRDGALVSNGVPIIPAVTGVIVCGKGPIALGPECGLDDMPAENGTPAENGLFTNAPLLVLFDLDIDRARYTVHLYGV
jgi:hypothetical protein